MKIHELSNSLKSISNSKYVSPNNLFVKHLFHIDLFYTYKICQTWPKIFMDFKNLRKQTQIVGISHLLRDNGDFDKHDNLQRNTHICKAQCVQIRMSSI